MIDFIGNSRKIVALKEVAKKIAASDVTVLISGETGTGKEVLANYIRSLSSRKNAPFVIVNCGSLSQTLAEDELFGHVKGAFTDALMDYKGKVAQAETGILLLDELGDLSLSIQAKLLRFLQFKEYIPIGGTFPVKANIRVIGITNKNLVDLVRAGEFREDLYYRFHIMPLEVPPLREREEDISLLAEYFIRKFSNANGKVGIGITWKAMRKLSGHHWYGNVRELENTLERAVVLSPNGSKITEDLILFDSVSTEGQFTLLPLKEAVLSFKREYIINALDEFHWNQTLTAKKLKVQRTYLARLIKELEISKI